MPPLTSFEVNGNAGPVPAITLTPSRDRLRANGAGKTITVSVRSGSGTVRHATVDNAGASGASADVAAGSSFTIGPTETRDVILVTGDSAVLGLAYS